MIQEEILEYNKRCAEFVGWKLDSEHSKYLYYSKNKPRVQVWDYRSMLYDSDWNWIMEVVEAIEKLELGDLVGLITDKNGNPDKHLDCKAGFEIGKYSCNIYIAATMRLVDNFIEIFSENKKEAVVQAINEFLIWYKEQTT